MVKLTKLFQPGMIGSLQLRNRIIMSAMGTFSADSAGYMTDRTIDYYVERAKGGVGLITSQATPVLRECASVGRACIYDDKFIPKLRELTSSIHQYGAKMAIQLQHHGKILGGEGLSAESVEELIPIGPSSVPWVRSGLAPKEATREDIKRLLQGFAQAARRVKEAGFDAVEIHGGHGYLISSFLSGFTNKRADEYGGSPENRARFACEILTQVRQRVGPDFPIILRISGCDYLPDGITIEDTLRQAPLFVEAGANALHVSASALETPEWQFLSYLWPDGAIVHLAEAVRKVVRVPIITVGKLSDPLVAELVLQEGKADFIAMGRGLLADPELPKKAREGRFDDIRRCIYCCNCESRTYQERLEFGGLFCTVNPALFREREFALKPAPSRKKVMVIGGGLAGMEAARVLAERGHQVSLYEKSSRVGGQWNIACQQPFKERFAVITNYLTQGMDKAGVNVILNKEVTLQVIEQIRPDAVVVATGAIPRILEVSGADGKNVVQASDVITGKVKAGDRVVVVGGRLVGMETADFLAEQGKQVAIVTLRRLGENGRKLNEAIYRTLRDRLISHGVSIYPNTPVVQITNEGVWANDNGDLLFLKADTVVLAVGMVSERKLANQLRDVVPEMYAIGDCVKPEDALAAIRHGSEIGRKI